MSQMKLNHLFVVILLSSLMASCSDALYRAYPKADKHRGETNVVETNKRKSEQIVVPDESLQSDQTVAEKRVESKVTIVGESGESVAVVSTGIPEQDQRAMDAVPVNDDTIEVDQEEQDFMIAQAELSERLPGQLRGWSIVTIVGWFFWPLYIIGLIGGIVTVIRYKSLIYVSERSMKQQRKAQRLFLTGVIVPLAVVALILILIFLAF